MFLAGFFCCRSAATAAREEMREHFRAGARCVLLRRLPRARCLRSKMESAKKDPFNPGEGNSVSKIIESLNDEWRDKCDCKM